MSAANPQLWSNQAAMVSGFVPVCTPRQHAMLSAVNSQLFVAAMMSGLLPVCTSRQHAKFSASYPQPALIAAMLSGFQYGMHTQATYGVFCIYFRPAALVAALVSRAWYWYAHPGNTPSCLHLHRSSGGCHGVSLGTGMHIQATCQVVCISFNRSSNCCVNINSLKSRLFFPRLMLLSLVVGWLLHLCCWLDSSRHSIRRRQSAAASFLKVHPSGLHQVKRMQRIHSLLVGSFNNTILRRWVLSS